MGRILTTPEVQPDAVQQCISGFRFEVPHTYSGTSMELSKLQIQVWYEVITYDAAGLIVKKETRIVNFADWPAGFKVDARAVYDKLYLDAETAGLIAGPGTDEPLE